MSGDHPPYGNWPVSDSDIGDHERLGVTEESDQMVLVNTSTTDVFVASVDREEERIGTPEPAEFGLPTEESIGEFLDRVGEEHGWEWLSEFSRDHLEDGE